MTDDYRFGRWIPAEQVPPDPQRVTEQVITRFEHVFEVEPGRMGDHFHQQPMPTWDTRRIVAARWDHLDAVHREFADDVLLAGEGPDPGPPITSKDSQPNES